MEYGKGRLVMALVLLVAMAAATAQDSPVGKGKVARAQFTTAVVEREPVDEIVLLDGGADHIYFFTELKFLQGRTIVHRWEYGGKVQAEVAFEVGGPRWRVYSRKTLLPTQRGDWTVVVVDKASGWPLEARMFRYLEPEDDGAE